jgi:hypothetical protein
VSAIVFYLVAILLVMVFPLAVPTIVSIVHAIFNWRQSAGAAQLVTAGPVGPAFAPAPRGAAAAAA